MKARNRPNTACTRLIAHHKHNHTHMSMVYTCKLCLPTLDHVVRAQGSQRQTAMPELNTGLSATVALSCIPLGTYEPETAREHARLCHLWSAPTASPTELKPSASRHRKRSLFIPGISAGPLYTCIQAKSQPCCLCSCGTLLQLCRMGKSAPRHSCQPFLDQPPEASRRSSTGTAGLTHPFCFDRCSYGEVRTSPV